MNPIILNVVNRLLSQVNLRYDEDSDSLYFSVDYYFDTIECFICEEFSNVAKILGLHKDFGQNTINDYNLLIASDLFNHKLFKKNKHEIRPFLDVLRDSNIEPCNYAKKKLNTVKLLRNTLNLDCEWMIDLSRFTKEDLSEIRNKYNGSLIKHWVSMPNKTNLIDHFTIEYNMSEFKKEVETSSDDYFMSYLINTPANQIRVDFLNYLTKKNAWYWRFNESETPFIF